MYVRLARTDEPRLRCSRASAAVKIATGKTGTSATGGKHRTMTAVSVALTHAYQNNIDRYRRLLRTRLTDLEREFIQRRLAEELSALTLLRQPEAA